MRYRIEEADKERFQHEHLDEQGKAVRDIFREKFLILEEMVEVMIDDEMKVHMIQSIVASYSLICSGIVHDCNGRSAKKAING